jgi:1-acyl-sn-glycerol-3-phosphate acyltransferase
MTGAHTVEHAWMPRSPCGSGCVSPNVEPVGSLRYAARWTALLLIVFLSPLLIVLRLLPTPVSARVQRRLARALLRACGIGFRCSGDQEFEAEGRAVMVVAQHVSWLDVVGLPAVQPVSMVARADVAEWMLIGIAARAVHTIFVDRARLRQLPEAVEVVRDRLRSGRTVAVFPEGTTWCGNGRGGFRSAFFQAAVDTGVPVRPVAVHYLQRAGGRTTAPAFVGDETMVQSLRRVLRLRGVILELTLLPVQQPGTDRRVLAARCTAAVQAVHGGGPSWPTDPMLSHSDVDTAVLAG